jgi:hypothetical protein
MIRGGWTYPLTPRNLATLTDVLKAAVLDERPGLLSDLRVRQSLGSALAQGARLSLPPRRRGRPKLYDGFSDDEDPRLTRFMDDLALLGQYQTVLRILQGLPVRQQRNEEFQQWVTTWPSAMARPTGARSQSCGYSGNPPAVCAI